MNDTIPDHLRGAALRNAAAMIQSAAKSLAAAERELAALGFDVNERVTRTRDPALWLRYAKADALCALELVQMQIERDAAHPDSKEQA